MDPNWYTSFPEPHAGDSRFQPNDEWEDYDCEDQPDNPDSYDECDGDRDG